MNYKKVYDQLVQKRRQHPISKEDCYCEEHHIIPRCVGGTNEPENLVNFTYREHYIAHLLLAKIYDTKGLYQAVKFMCVRPVELKKTLKMNSRLYQKMKEYYNQKMSLDNPASRPEVRDKIRNTLKGRKLPKKHKNNISQGLYKKFAAHPEIRAKMSASHKGKKLSDEHKALLRESKIGKNNPNYGMHWYNNGVTSVMSYECPPGFKRGRLSQRRQSRATC